jgi:MoxR-like ATPase
MADRSILISRTGENVTAARDVMFCAASNTTGHGDQTGTYVDRNQMDAAFRDRFSDIVLVAYPPAAAERKILSNRTGLSKAAAHILVEYARATRARADKEQDVAQGVGLRRLLAWATGLIGGINAELIFRTTVVNQHSQEEGEVLWQLYKSTVDEAALVAAVAAPESDGPADAPAIDTDVFADAS